MRNNITGGVVAVLAVVVLFLAYLSHAANADAQVVEHSLGDSNELLARRSDRNASRGAIEQPDAEHVLDAFDGSGQRGLRSSQKRSGGDEAVVFRYGENGV